ncbi:hypothetical protein [uncultured Prevotella sp.]|uniref:hypothetical protein n=1 Tax=uncultured Prevotella sp. TaxID=159272 RepID=UPI002586F961|nr:hypothetical protein [uncultured Prevotella sp.]
MKKIILIIAFLCSMSLFANEQGVSNLNFSVGYVVKTGTRPHPKAPALPPDVPDVTLEGNILTFTSEHDDYTLTVINEDEEVAYEVIVPSTVCVVVFPSSLTGDYELQLDYGGNFYFYCGITL